MLDKIKAAIDDIRVYHLYTATIGTDGKVYSVNANRLLHDEIVMTATGSHKYNGLNPQNKHPKASERVESGEFNDIMAKALKDGADPTVGLQIAANLKSVPVVEEMLARGANPASRGMHHSGSGLLSFKPAPVIPAIDVAASNGHIGLVKTMWDHIAKDPSKYPDFDAKMIGQMAYFGEKGAASLYIVDRAKKELSPKDYEHVMQEALRGARNFENTDVLAKLRERGGITQGSAAFEGYGAISLSTLSPQEQANLTKEFIKDLDAQKRISPDTLKDALESAIELGLPGAIRASIAKGADPLKSNNIHLMIMAENGSLDALKAATEPLIKRGSPEEIEMLKRLRNTYNTEMSHNIESKRSIFDERMKMIVFVETAVEKLDKKTGKDIKVSDATPSVDDIHNQLMGRLKEGTTLAAAPTEPAAASPARTPVVVPKLEPTLG